MGATEDYWCRIAMLGTCFRCELNPFKVSVHVVEPGYFATPMNSYGTAGPYLRSFELAWNRASTELHKEYGSEHILAGYAKRMNE